MKPRVDIGVVTYNTRDLTVEALRRLVAGNVDSDLRIFVRDNGSSDGTADAVRKAFPDAVVDAGDENLGFAAGVNTILQKSDAPFFLLLNSDAWPVEGAVGRLVAAAEAHPEAAAVAPRIERPDGVLEHSTHPFPSVRIALLVALGGHRWLPRSRREALALEGAWLHDRPREVDWAVGAALLLRRDALTEIGLFDNRFFMYAEDLEWCWRARRHGWSVWFDPSALVRHVGNASGRDVYGDERTAAYLRNTHRFFRAEHGPVAAFLYRLFNLVATVRHALTDRLRGNRERARWWARQARVHATPVRGPDRPPERSR